MTWDSSGIRYGLVVRDGAHRGANVSLLDLLQAHWWVHLMMSVDVERIIRWLDEQGVNPEVLVTVSGREVDLLH